MNLTLTRSGKFGIETSGKQPIGECFTSLTKARSHALTAAAAINDRLAALKKPAAPPTDDPFGFDQMERDIPYGDQP